MKHVFLFFCFPYFVFGQFVTDYPSILKSNTPDLVLEKVVNSTLRTSLTFKFTYKKKSNTNPLGRLLGLNPDKVAVCIRDKSFLVDSLKGKRYEMLRAIDIPYCSAGRTYLSNNQSLIFDLYFERLEQGLEVFDFKEGVFFDTTLINRNTWEISGIEALNPREGEVSKIKNSKSSIHIAKSEEDSGKFYFVETKAELLPESEIRLQEFLKLNLDKLQNAKKILIEGHTDRIGDYEKNRTLSLQRADLINEILLKENIDKNIIQVKGYSHLKILSFRRDEESKIKNRRVEVKIM
ncbi:OmpA family protein [Lacihabitans sp. LS3-19]|uniref:OmpA family protein n=1 Tax=Lacihabitans sp. LS3-19 TaxID=2487335 RepID=UPI0020CEF655|nr:OmpA family protein [Lacihabitans sp. LS3-19]MCP9767491.1 OmpA family protein [Lacihabitans sp. LS3-19]